MVQTLGAAGLRVLAESVSDIDWFAAVGQPLSNDLRTKASRYLSGLGYDNVAVERVSDWPAAADITRDPAWDADWWAREEAYRCRLLDICIARCGEKTALDLLTAAAAPANDNVLRAASEALARANVDDPYLARVAAGAATQVLHQAALAALAGNGDDDPFAVKFAIFRAGRWPLGIVGGIFHIF